MLVAFSIVNTLHTKNATICHAEFFVRVAPAML